MIVLKKTRLLRYLSYWLYVIATIGIPIIFIAWQFDLFKKPGILQITGYGIIAIIIVAFICKGHVVRAIADMNKGIARTILQNIMRLVPYLIFWIVLTFLETYIVKVRFILFWSVIGNIGATFLDIWHSYLVKKCEEESK